MEETRTIASDGLLCPYVESEKRLLGWVKVLFAFLLPLVDGRKMREQESERAGLMRVDGGWDHVLTTVWGMECEGKRAMHTQARTAGVSSRFARTSWGRGGYCAPKGSGRLGKTTFSLVVRVPKMAQSIWQGCRAAWECSSSPDSVGWRWVGRVGLDGLCSTLSCVQRSC